MITADQVADALGGKRAGSGWLCRCPAHDDKIGSLSVGVGDKRPVIVNCKAGCSGPEVIAALKAMSLWNGNVPQNNGHRAAPVHKPKPEEKLWKPITPVPPSAPRPPATHSRHGTPSNVYTYRTPCGGVSFIYERYDMPDGGKEFSWLVYGRHLAEQRWIRKNLFGHNLPAYNLHLLASRPDDDVVFFEGEKCCEAALTLVPEYVPSTWPGGGNNVIYLDIEPFRGRTCYIWYDNDNPGVNTGKLLAERLRTVAAAVYICKIPYGKPKKWDIYDCNDAAEARHIITSGKAVKKSEETQTDRACSELHLTDLGNAERLAARYGKNFKYCYQTLSWYCYDGVRWISDDGRHIHSAMANTSRSIFREIAYVDDTDKRAKMAKWTHNSESLSKINAAILLAHAKSACSIEEFDQNPMLLNCANGTVDLVSGTLRDHNRDCKITKLVPHDYKPNAKCPVWESFVLRIMDGDNEMVDFLQRAIGYSLTGLTNEQCLIIMHGSGQNGKSTFLQTLRTVMGEYCRTADPSTFMSSKNDSQRGPRPDLVALRGARFVSAIEIDEGQRFAESLVKSLTGQDAISTRDLYGKQFEFYPQFKIWLAANHKPVIRGQDSGIWRRIRLVPFAAQITESERDYKLLEKLEAEAAGILTWAVKGCLLWQKHGLGTTDKIRAATESYQKESDRLIAFIEARCMVQPGVKATAKNLYESYKNWCDETGERQDNQTNFGRRLTERGFHKRRTDNGYIYDGIGIPG